MLYRTKILDEEGIQHALSYGRPGQKKVETWNKQCSEIKGWGMDYGAFYAEWLDQEIANSDHEAITLSNARTGFTYKEYSKLDSYDWHSDEVTSSDGLRLDVSTTLFLSEPDEYEGGELDLRFGDFCISIKLPAGYACMYPTGLIHRVKPVRSGIRKVIHWWDQSNVQNPFVRDSIINLSGGTNTDLYTSQLERFC